MAGAITTRRPGSKGTCGPYARCGCRASRGGGRCGDNVHLVAPDGEVLQNLGRAVEGPRAEGPYRHRCGRAGREWRGGFCRAVSSLRTGTRAGGGTASGEGVLIGTPTPHRHGTDRCGRAGCRAGWRRWAGGAGLREGRDGIGVQGTVHRMHRNGPGIAGRRGCRGGWTGGRAGTGHGLGAGRPCATARSESQCRAGSS